MKRYWTIALTALTVFLVAVAAWKMWPRTVPLEECSGIYQHYHDNPHVVASFLKDFRVNDTVTVDVTLLEAKDDEGWEEICQRFDIKPYSSEAQEIANAYSVSTKLVPRKKNAETPNSILSNNYLLVISRHSRTVSIFDTKYDAQLDAIFNFHIIKTIKNENENTCMDTLGSVGNGGHELPKRITG